MFKLLFYHLNRYYLYSKLPIYSFTLKAKIPKKIQPVIIPTTLGEHIRKVRFKRNHSQKHVSNLLNINQMHLSSWELNQKTPHPKHLDAIIEYLGYIPNITSKIEKLGMRTKLYRMKYDLSMKDFLQMPNINSNIVMKLERLRFCKVPKIEERTIEKVLKQKPTYFCEATLK